MAQNTPSTSGSGHRFLNPVFISNTALYRLKNAEFFPMLCGRNFESDFTGRPAVGNTIYIKRPFYAAPPKRGRTIDNDDFRPFIERTISLTIDEQLVIPLQIQADDEVLNVSPRAFQRRFIDPHVETMVRDYNKSGLNKVFRNWHYMNGTPGTAISFATAQHMNDHAIEMSVPSDGRNYAIMHTQEATQLTLEAHDLKSSDVIQTQSIRHTYRGMVADHLVFSSPLIPSQKVKGFPTTATPQVRGASQRGDTIPTDGWGVNNTKVLYKGQKISFAGVNEVMVTDRDDDFTTVGSKEIRLKTETGRAMTFTVTEDVTTNGSGQADIKISPEIIGADSGQTFNNPSGVDATGESQSTLDGSMFQNVSALPADNATITVLGRNTTANADKRYRQSLFMHSDAHEFVCLALPRPAEVPDGGYGEVTDGETGFKLSSVKRFHFESRTTQIRIDGLFGNDTTRPDLLVGCWGKDH